LPAFRFIRLGIGSGFTLRTADEASIDLITLYTATKTERESRSAEQRASQSRLMAALGGTAEEPAVSELHPAVKELCRTLDGFVYVVDATAPADHGLYLFFTLSITLVVHAEQQLSVHVCFCVFG